MANEATSISQAKEMIQNRITSNGAKQITGQVLQEVLLGVVTAADAQDALNEKGLQARIDTLETQTNSAVNSIQAIEDGTVAGLCGNKGFVKANN